MLRKLKNEIKSKQDLAKKENDFILKKQENETKLTQTLNKLDQERLKNEADARKIETDFKRQQQIYEAQNEILQTDINIALTRNGYTNERLTDKGYVKKYIPFLSSNSAYFYRIDKLTIGDSIYAVFFEYSEENKTGRYYILIGDNEPRHYLNTNNLFTTTLNGKNISDLNDESLKNANFTVVPIKRWIKLPQGVTGGKKTYKKRGTSRKPKRSRTRRSR